MSAAIPHQIVPVLAIKQTLADDIVLAAMTVTGFDGQPRTIRGIHYLAVPQEDVSLGPWVVIGTLVKTASVARKHPNGPNRIAAAYSTPVWLHVRDVEPDDLDLNKMLQQIVKLLEGNRIEVDGGEAFEITVDRDATSQRIDNGSYIFTAIGVKFLVAAQVT